MAMRAGAISIVAAVVLSACAAPSPPPPPAPPEPAAPAVRSPYVEIGIASWYGRGHQGRQTASGERYDMNAMTAAHRTLPFGTVVRVTNLDNHRSVRVRINDRGPRARDRILDLSAAAARSLDMTEAGIAHVRIEVAND